MANTNGNVRLAIKTDFVLSNWCLISNMLYICICHVRATNYRDSF